jgi:hypothetical protein
MSKAPEEGGDLRSSENLATAFLMLGITESPASALLAFESKDAEMEWELPAMTRKTEAEHEPATYQMERCGQRTKILARIQSSLGIPATAATAAAFHQGTSTRSGILQGPESGVGGAGGVKFYVLVTILAHFEPQTRRTRSGTSQGPETGCVRFRAQSRPICETIGMARANGCHRQYASVVADCSPRGN